MLLQATLLVLVASGSLAYPYGPPVTTNPEICTTMRPEHSADPMTTESPFEISSGKCYNADTTVTVEAKIKPGNDTYFEGVFIIARQLDAAGNPVTSTAVGMFDVGADADLQTLDCFNDTKSSAGHKQKAHYESKIFKWTGPMNATQGDKIQFVATFVRETEEYWLDVRSVVVSYDVNCTTVTADPTTTPPAETTTNTGVAVPTLEVAMIVFLAVSFAFLQR